MSLNKLGEMRDGMVANVIEIKYKSTQDREKNFKVVYELGWCGTAL